MSDLKKYVAGRKVSDSQFSDKYDEGYQSFKIGVLLKETRLASALTKKELATK